jgi:hypothetical protein
VEVSTSFADHGFPLVGAGSMLQSDDEQARADIPLATSATNLFRRGLLELSLNCRNGLEQEP